MIEQARLNVRKSTWTDPVRYFFCCNHFTKENVNPPSIIPIKNCIITNITLTS